MEVQLFFLGLSIKIRKTRVFELQNTRRRHIEIHTRAMGRKSVGLDAHGGEMPCQGVWESF